MYGCSKNAPRPPRRIVAFMARLRTSLSLSASPEPLVKWPRINSCMGVKSGWASIAPSSSCASGETVLSVPTASESRCSTATTLSNAETAQHIERGRVRDGGTGSSARAVLYLRVHWIQIPCPCLSTACGVADRNCGAQDATGSPPVIATCSVRSCANGMCEQTDGR